MPDKSSKTKKAQDETIIKNLPGGVEWIRQPYALSVMRGDLSLTQTHIMVELMGALQVKINDFIAHMGQEGNAVFTEADFDENGVAHVDVSLAAVSNRPDYYADVESMAYRLMGATIKRPEEVDGMKMLKLSHVFDSILVPFEDNERGRRKGFIRFCFNREQARDIFNFTRYSKYIKAVARNSSSQYTSRLYMIITAYKTFGRWEVEYSELRKILGFLAYEEDGAGQWRWVEKKYTEYRQFKRRVLNTAAEELRALAERGEADCHFDFEEVYPPGRRNGTPDKILFTITVSDMGRQQDMAAISAKKIIAAEETLRREFGFRASEVRQVLGRVTPANIDLVAEKINQVRQYIAQGGERIIDRKRYAFTALRNLLDDCDARPDDTPDTDNGAPTAANGSPTPDNGASTATNGASTATNGGSTATAAASRSEWDGAPFTHPALRGPLTTRFGLRVYNTYLMQVRIIAHRGDTVTLHIPHEEVSDYIDSAGLADALRDTLSQVIGRVQTINYLLAIKNS